MWTYTSLPIDIYTYTSIPTSNTLKSFLFISALEHARTSIKTSFQFLKVIPMDTYVKQ